MPSNTNDYSLVIILLVFVAFMFFSGRRRKAAASQLANSVKVGADVVMIGGITGKVASIGDSTLVVETTPGTRIEFLKAAVRSVSTPSLDKVKAPAVPVKKSAAPKTPVANKPATTKVTKPSSSATKKTAK